MMINTTIFPIKFQAVISGSEKIYIFVWYLVLAYADIRTGWF